MKNAISLTEQLEDWNLSSSTPLSEFLSIVLQTTGSSSLVVPRRFFFSAPSWCDIKVLQDLFPNSATCHHCTCLLGGLILVSDCWVGNSKDLMIKTFIFSVSIGSTAANKSLRFLYSCSRSILLTPVSSMLSAGKDAVCIL